MLWPNPILRIALSVGSFILSFVSKSKHVTFGICFLKLEICFCFFEWIQWFGLLCVMESALFCHLFHLLLVLCIGAGEGGGEVIIFWQNCYCRNREKILTPLLWPQIHNNCKKEDRYDGGKISITKLQHKTNFRFIWIWSFVVSDPNSFLWVIIGAGMGCAQNTKRRGLTISQYKRQTIQKKK